MADKPTLNDFAGSARLDVTKLNANNTTIEDAIENSLGRGGTGESNNSMTGALDMDLNRIQNLGTPIAEKDAVRLIDLSDSDATGAASATLRIDTLNALSVDTYTNLRAITVPPAFDIAIVQGRSTVGDGGQGIFRWDSSDLSTEVTADTQSGVYVAPSSDTTGASGAWVRQYSGSINVNWFGAYGSGADETSSLQAAMDLLTNTGGKVYVPTGTYIISGLGFVDGVYLVGAGKASTIFKLPDNGDDQILSNLRATEDYVVVDVSISGITFDGNADNFDVTKDARTAVSCSGVDGFVATDCEFTNATGYGLAFQAISALPEYFSNGEQKNISLFRCIFSENGVGTTTSEDSWLR